MDQDLLARTGPPEEGKARNWDGSRSEGLGRKPQAWGKQVRKQVPTKHISSEKLEQDPRCFLLILPLLAGSKLARQPRSLCSRVAQDKQVVIFSVIPLSQMMEAGVEPSASGLEINHMAVSTASHDGRHFSGFLLVGTQETTFSRS